MVLEREEGYFQSLKRIQKQGITAINYHEYTTDFKYLNEEIKSLKEFFTETEVKVRILISKFPLNGYTLMDVLPAFEISFHTIALYFRSDKFYVEEKSKLSEEDWSKFKDLIFNHGYLQQLLIYIFKEEENLLPCLLVKINLKHRDVAERKIDAFYACECYEDYENFLDKYLKI